jgi:sortase family protein
MRPYARSVVLLGVALLAVTVLTGAQPSPGATARPAAARVPAAGSAPIAANSFRSARTYPTVAAPVRLRIPALHVDSAVQRLGLQADGTVAVPKRTDVAGWYERGPRPGQPGPAVILGHVDSHTGPGIFINLATLRAGTLVRVDLADGSTVMFRISRIERVSKTRFPTDLVYAPTLDPTLRLVTCGGSFDHSRGSYRDNVIAFADQV